MSELELILREIGDPHIRENFFRLLRYVRDEPILQGNWKLHEWKTDKAVTNSRVAHNHTFKPTDIILLSSIGDQNFQFNYDKFTKKTLSITAGGAVKLRFLSGSYKEVLDGISSPYPNVPIGTGPSAPPAPSAARISDIFDTDASTAVGDLVRVSGTNFVSTIANNTVATIPNGIFGVAYDKPTTTTAEVLFTGLISGFSGFTAGLPLYVSTGGAPTHTKPATGVVQQIGFATRTTEFFLNMLQPLRQA